MKSNAESGNVLFIILIAIALFAALSFAVSNIMRSGNAEAISEQRASILADEILAQIRDIRQTVLNLRISNGCEDIDISFENPTVAGYEHTPVADDKCKVFHPSGGGLNYIVPVQDWSMPISPTPVFHREHYFTGSVIAQDIGTAERDLVYFLPYISLPICLQLNQKLGIDNPAGSPPVEAANGWTTSNVKFTGEYSSGGTQLQRGGAMAGCFEGNNVSSTPPTGTYHFFQILLPR